MRRVLVLLAAIAALPTLGCRTTEVLSGWDSYVPTFGMTSTEEAELPSPDQTLKSPMPAVEGDWKAP
jgi:hypothetical protein